MELFGNTFFWSFFFIIGLVATLELIDDVGPQLLQRWLHVSVESAWLIVGYALMILWLVRLLRVLGTTYSWTANTLRNATMLLVVSKIRKPKALGVFLGATFLSFWPFWDWNPWAVAGFAATLALLVPLNHYRNWLLARPAALFAAVGAAGVVYWLFDAYAYHYRLADTLLIIGCFWAVMAIGYFYDRMLIFRKQQMRSLMYDTQHDDLTGALSRTKFASDIARWRRLRVAGKIPPVHLAMLDLDHFKRINDVYGHLAGDAVLRQFTKRCQAFIEAADYPCALYRTGGEEFSLIIAGGADDAGATALVEGLVASCRNTPVQAGNQLLHLTVSAGLTSIFKADQHADNVIGRADSNLYSAKHGGRDTTVADVAGGR
ncbi:GGDEF domain-containing protein [Lacticaseibacillus suihuaensis]